jgi:hypothetical protein
MRRGLWFAAGAGAGIYAAVRGRRAAEAFTPDGLRDRWQAIGLGARMLRDEVAQGKAEAEPRLRERLRPGLDRPAGLDTPALVPRAGDSTTAQDTPTIREIQEGKQ